MSKSEYLLKFLSTMDKATLPITDDLIFLIQSNQVSDELIDSLVMMVKDTINSTKDELEKEKLQKSLTFLTKLQHAEQTSKLQDKADIDELESLLENM